MLLPTTPNECQMGINIQRVLVLQQEEFKVSRFYSEFKFFRQTSWVSIMADTLTSMTFSPVNNEGRFLTEPRDMNGLSSMIKNGPRFSRSLAVYFLPKHYKQHQADESRTGQSFMSRITWNQTRVPTLQACHCRNNLRGSFP